MDETILETDGKIKSRLRRIVENRELFPAVLVLVIGLVSFGLGRLSVQQTSVPSESHLLSSVSEAQNIVGGDVSPPDATTTSTEGGGTKGQRTTEMLPKAQAISASGQYVASKNGTKYHLPWCSGAQRITEANKIWFASKAEAEAAGYTPAANCKGI